jgi:cell division protein ZapA
MGQVSVTVNGHRFDITCDDGQEAHVCTLAAEIDRRVCDLVERIGNLGDARMLLLAALLLCDDLEAARTEAAALREALGGEGGAPPLLSDGAVGGTLLALASRIEAVAARLKET